MKRSAWSRILDLGGARRKAELDGQLAAIHKSQAVIEFDLQGHVLAANQNFLDTMGYEEHEVIGQHHRHHACHDTSTVVPRPAADSMVSAPGNPAARSRMLVTP